MTDPALADIALPVTLGPFGCRTVPQRSDEDIAQCVYVLCATPLRWRDDAPTAGLSDQRFKRDGPDISEINRLIDKHEPDAAATVTRNMDLIAQAIQSAGIGVRLRA